MTRSAHRVACTHGFLLALLLDGGAELWRIVDRRARLLGWVLDWYEVRGEEPLTGSWT